MAICIYMYALADGQKLLEIRSASSYHLTHAERYSRTRRGLPLSLNCDSVWSFMEALSNISSYFICAFS